MKDGDSERTTRRCTRRNIGAGPYLMVECVACLVPRQTDPRGTQARKAVRGHRMASEKNQDPAPPDGNLPDGLFLAESRFPSTDELGRLLCKNCGLPYQSWTVRGLLEKSPMFEAAQFQVFNCLRCRKLSMFLPAELPFRADISLRQMLFRQRKLVHLVQFEVQLVTSFVSRVACRCRASP